MAEENKDNQRHILAIVTDYIGRLTKKFRYRKKVRAEIRQELQDHFEDALRDIEPEKRQEAAEKLITDFGDPKLLAILMRRAKKRCRPLWVKILLKSSLLMAILVLYIGIRIAFVTLGTPGSKVDYIAYMNRIVRADRDKELNSQPLYAQAAKIFKASSDDLYKYIRKWPADMNEPERQKTFEWIDENEKTIKLFRQASQKPYFWFDYSPDPNSLKSRKITPETLVVNLPSKELSKCRQLTVLMQASIYRDAYNGNYKQSIDDLMRSYDFGWKMQGEKTLVEQLVGVSIEALSHHKLSELAKQTDIPDGELLKLQKFLQAYYNLNKPLISMDVEKLFMYDMIQRGFTDDGRMLKGALPLVANNWKEVLKVLFWNTPDQNKIKANIDTFYDQMNVFIEEPPSEYTESSLSEEYLPQHLQILFPAFERVGQLGWRLKTEREAVLSIIAVKRFEKANNALPNDLQQLVDEDFLERLPQDFFCDGPLKYKKLEGEFLVYSCGSDRKDDGGVSGEKLYADEGDWVFWPRKEK